MGGRRESWGEQLSAEQYTVQPDASPVGYSRGI